MGYLTKFKLILDPSLTMANFWDKAAAVYGDRMVAFLEDPLEYARMPESELTYDMMLRLTNMFGNVLLGLGVGRGDRVVIATGNRVELLTLCYSCMKIGAIAVPLNYMLKGSEIKYIAENCGARVLVTDRDVFDSNIRDQSVIPGIETWVMAGKREINLPGCV